MRFATTTSNISPPAPSLTPSPSISPPFTSLSSAPVASASLNPTPSSFPVIHLPSDPLPTATTQPKASYLNPPGGQSENDPNNTTIFVGNLDPNVTDDHLKQVFSQYGELVHVKIPSGKRCGFIQFSDRSCAEEAIRVLNGGRTLSGLSFMLLSSPARGRTLFNLNGGMVFVIAGLNGVVW